MQEEILLKDNLLKKAADDMKFYKLELINREESYNKMFGATPNIGVLNPLSNKPSTGKPAPMGMGGIGSVGGMGIGGKGMGSAISSNNGINGAGPNGGGGINTQQTNKNLDRKNSRIS